MPQVINCPDGLKLWGVDNKESRTYVIADLSIFEDGNLALSLKKAIKGGERYTVKMDIRAFVRVLLELNNLLTSVGSEPVKLDVATGYHKRENGKLVVQNPGRLTFNIRNDEPTLSITNGTGSLSLVVESVPDNLTGIRIGDTIKPMTGYDKMRSWIYLMLEFVKQAPLQFISVKSFGDDTTTSPPAVGNLPADEFPY